MQRLGGLVPKAIEKLKAGKNLEFYRLKEAWLSAVGPIMATQTEPKKVQGRTLYVVVGSPHWSQEISLNQRTILRRLRERLGRAPSRIVCWVGQPHLHLDPATEPAADAEPLPWADWPIPESRRRAIEATVSSLDEVELQTKLRRLLELSVQRELYLVAQGRLPCSMCGDLYEPDRELCPECLKQRTEDRDRAVLRLLSKRPWLTGRDLQEMAPSLTRQEVLNLRKTLHTDWITQAWQRTEGADGAELDPLFDATFAQLLEGIAMLRCSLQREQLEPRHLLFALGKRLGNGYLRFQRRQRDGAPPAE